ncbi:hypothetical protein Btru_022863 [Bulinus truncatus]|nr:hypothetical protein Btru_022863 [Bulinus truncatus]
MKTMIKNLFVCLILVTALCMKTEARPEHHLYRAVRQVQETTTRPTTTQRNECGTCPAGQQCYRVYPMCTTPPPDCTNCVFPCPPFYMCSSYPIN